MQTHAAALFVSVCIAVVFGAPDVVLSRVQDAPFTPLTAATTYNLDECVYAAVFQDMRDGHLRLGDPYLWEYKSAPNPYACSNELPAVVMSCLSLVAGSLSAAFSLALMIFPPITFLLAYVIVWRWGGSRAIALVSATAMLTVVQIVNPSLLFDFSFMREFRANAMGTAAHTLYHFNSFARVPSIALNFVPTLLSVYFCGEGARRGDFRAAALGGVFLGLLFYTYFFHWTLIYGGLGLASAAFLATRRWKAAGCLMVAGGVGLLVGIPYLLTSWQFQHDPHAADLMRRIGIERGWKADLTVWRYLPFGLVPLAWGLMRRGHEELVLLGAMVIAACGLVNVQVMTGKAVQNGHWLPRGVDPLCFLIVGVMAGSLLGPLRDRFARWGRVCALPVCAVMLAYAACAQASYIVNTAGAQALDRDEAALLAWLDTSTRTDDVILTLSVEDGVLIPAWTRDNVYLPMGWVTNAPDGEIVERLLTACRLYDVPATTLSRLLARDNAWVEWCVDGEKRRFFDRVAFEDAAWNMFVFGWKYFYRPHAEIEDALPPAVREKVAGGAPQFYIPAADRVVLLDAYAATPTDPRQLLRRFRLDYLVVDRRSRQLGQLDAARAPWLERCATLGEIEVYRVRGGTTH